MGPAKIFHNPRCSKSRQTLSLLQDHGLDVEIVEYLQRPPSLDELDRICQRLGMDPQSLVRLKEKRFTELGLSLSDERSREEWLEILTTNPVLLERPIVVVGKRAAIGRPPENVLEIL